MSIRGARILQIIAVCLLGAAFLFTVAAIPLQGPLKGWFTVSPEVIDYHSVPVAGLAFSFLRCGLAVFYLIAVCTGAGEKKSRVVVIVVGILWAVTAIILSPLSNSLETLLVGNSGLAATASMGALKSVLSLVTGPLNTAGALLMFLSMGGFYGKGGKRG